MHNTLKWPLWVLVIAIATALLLAPQAHAAHTFDTKANILGSGNPVTLSYTCGIGATLLVLGIVVDGDQVRTAAAPTYAGVEMTKVDSTRIATETNVEMWYLANPPTGSAYAISVPNGTNWNLYLIASSYKAGLGYTSALDTSNGGTGTTANPSVGVTTSVNGDVVVDVLGHGYRDLPTWTYSLLSQTDDGAFSANGQFYLQPTSGSVSMSWTVSADDWAMVVGAFKEVTGTPLYRSVGRGRLGNGEDLNLNARTVEISAAGTATFSGDMPNNVGGGDVLQYLDGSTYYLAFIHGRTSSTVYTVRDKDGGTAGLHAVLAGTAVSVFRAYIELQNWQNITVNSNIDVSVRSTVNPSKNLVTANTVMMVPCYGDGYTNNGMDSTNSISGWTTGPGNWIKIYTPVSSSEVGISQRHSGTWDTSKFKIHDTRSTLSAGIYSTSATNLWIDGLQIYANTIDTAGDSGIRIIGGSNVLSHRISNCIIKSASSTTLQYGIYFSGAAGTIGRIWNNIVYDFTGNSASAGIGHISASTTMYAYNNTVYGNAVGFWQNGGTVTVKNNMSYGNTDNYSGTFDANGTNNLSGPQQTDAPGLSPRNGPDRFVTFINEGGKDLHLASPDIGAKDLGASLSADTYLAFTTDIDGQSRPGGSAWDIGADEVPNTLTLGDHTLGQVGDQFTTTTPVTAVLFRFKLTRAEAVTVANIRVNYTTGGGVVDGDVTAGALYRDNNNDGAVDGGDTALRTGMPGSGGMLVFAAINESPATGGTNYLVQAQIANLVAGDTTTFSLDATGIDESQAGVVESGSISNATHTRDATLTVGNHTLGQVGDQFATASPVTAVQFRFYMTRAGTVTISQLRLNFTTAGGVVDADVTGGELYVDGNHNGVVDDGAAIQTGVVGSGGKLTFTTPFNPATGFTDYIVRATVANLVTGDTTTFSLGTGDIDEAEAGVVESGTISNATHTQDFTLLTFNSKYVVTSSTSITNATTSLADDTYASQTFSLAASQTVLAIYNPFNNHGSAEQGSGKQIAINVDDTDRAHTWNSPYADNGADGATTFWIGTLAAGSHTIKGRFASNSFSTATIDERILLIVIFDGDAYWYIDDATARTTASSSLVNDPSATQAFTLSGTCPTLILYNVGNAPGSTEDQNGKYAAINLGGTDYSKLIKSANLGDRSDNVFTLHYASLAAGSYTAQGRFSSRTGATVTISRRQLGVLLFADSTLADYNYSDAPVSTTSLYPFNDGPTLMSRTTAESRELLVVASGSSDYQTQSTTGLAYGIQVDGIDRTKSRTSPRNISQNSGLSATAWAEGVAAGSHTVRGRYGNNAGSSTVYVTSRRIVALWFADIGFKYRRPITLNYAQRGTSCTAPDTPLADFPVLVSVTDATLKTIGNGGHVQSANGYDIIFRASDGITQLDHEMEKYDGSTGQVVAWVRIPSLFEGDTDTIIYMYYGNSAITSPTANPTGVWDSSYKGVWHLKEATGAQVNDSTTTPNNGAPQNSPVQVGGKIDGSLSFNPASNQYVQVPDNTDLQLSTNMTVSAWVNTTDSTSQSRPAVAKWGTAGNRNYWLGKYWDNTSLFLAFDVNNSATKVTIPWSINDGNWHYVVGVADVANSLVRLYVDGAEQATVAYGGTSETGTSELDIGKNPNDTLQYWTGGIDEVRVSSSARNVCWIGTECKNQSDPGTFFTLGSEQSPAPTAIKLSSFTVTGERNVVKVQWETKTEIDNLGFNLYRSTQSNGTYTKLNSSLIPGLLSSAMGRKYSFTDSDVIRGKLYYYKLEDIDLKGQKTMHGPICVDWDGDGIADDIDPTPGVPDPATPPPPDPDPAPEPGTYPVTEITLEGFRAHLVEEEGVLLEWQTGEEVSNLGFHIYREQDGELTRLTPEPVAGSAFLAGSRTALRAGHRYHWWDFSALDTRHSSLATNFSSLDTRPSTLGSLRYWLEDLDLSGKRTMHGPAEMESPVINDQLSVSKKNKPELLSEIGWRLNERYHQYWKARELKERLRQRSSVISNQSSQIGFASNLKAEGRSSNLQRLGAGGRTSNLKPLSLSPQSSSLDIAMQQFLAGRPAVKLYVREERWYRVSQPQLVAAGLSPRANPRYLQLFVEGREQPIGVIDGKDGGFGPRDFIEFYGVGLDTASTDTRVYWLVEGSKPGKRIQGYKGYSGSLGSLSYPQTIEKKGRTIYFSALLNGEDENFFGPVVYMNEVDQILELEHLDRDSTEDAVLEVVLQGATDTPHRVRVLLNEVELGEIVFERQRKGSLRAEIPQLVLEEGENLVSLVASEDEMDATLLDTIKLTYWHTYTADNDSLRFTAQGGGCLRVDGFSDPEIRVFDITDSNEVIEVIGKVEPQQLGGYAVSFRVPGTAERTLLALTEERAKNPIEVVSNDPSRWHEERKGYDLVIISHGDFTNNLEPLKQLRESQGLRVALTDIEDLYDEFSFGAKSPKALKDFLDLAKRSWSKAPRFVLLVGDASFDPRNYLGLGDMDYVPTKLIDTVYMETASDDWLVDLDSDGLPEMAIGRLPVQTAEETATVVSKIIGYENSSEKKEALLVADRQEEGDFDFEGASEEVRALLPAYLTVRKIFREQFSSDAQAKATLLNDINQGALLVNFIGHGSVGSWRGSLLTLEDADELINGLKLPFFVNMTCLNGYFQNPYGETLAEALMKAGGGAIAIWTSSGLTEPDKQALMNKELIRLLFGTDSITLGEATARAKAATVDQDVRKTWILFGDPTTRFK